MKLPHSQKVALENARKKNAGNIAMESQTEIDGAKLLKM